MSGGDERTNLLDFCYILLQNSTFLLDSQADLKSVGSNTVPVRVRPRVHDEKPDLPWGFCYIAKFHSFIYTGFYSSLFYFMSTTLAFLSRLIKFISNSFSSICRKINSIIIIINLYYIPNFKCLIN